jgi:sugar phosphate permease
MFVGEVPLSRSTSNIMKIRMKALSKIEKQIRQHQNANGEENKQTLKQMLGDVITNKIFLLLCGSLTGLYFVVTGI